MSKSLDFYFDFGSPASYLAWTQLPQLQADCGAELNYRPILLGGVFQATGNQPPIAVPAKGRYVFTDLARYAKRYGVALKMNPHFPVNTLLLMRGATGLLLRQDPRFVAYCDAMFHAIWRDELNMAESETVGAALTKAGFNPATLLALCNAQEVKDELKAATASAIERGVFGAPSFFVGEQMFWGQDRLDWVRAALA